MPVDSAEACLAMHAPRGTLGAFVAHIWVWRGPALDHALERMLPSAQAHLVINLAEDETRVYDDALRCRRMAAATLDGPAWRGFTIDTHEQTDAVGIVFRCGAAAAFFNERMDALTNAHVALDDLLGSPAGRLRERLLHTPDAQRKIGIIEHWLTQQLRKRTPDPLVAQLLARLHPGVDVTSLAGLYAETGLSARRASARFRVAVGLSPKRYLRLQRFHRLVKRVHGQRQVDWVALALAGGFADQAHLANEFRAFSGLTPGAYLRQQGPWSNHVPLNTASGTR